MLNIVAGFEPFELRHLPIKTERASTLSSTLHRLFLVHSC